MFKVIDISEQVVEDYEQMGTKSKFWFTDKNSGKEFLFKSTHTEDKLGNKVVREGENWSEKIACEIAKLLGIPHADYELAQYNGEHGTISENFRKEGDVVTFGNSLIEYVTELLSQSLEQGQRSQEVVRVSLILNRIIINPPRGYVPSENIKSAHDVFLGYLALDVLISNQDRHSENWGMITDLEGKVYLAPSFDHAASLGRNESDEKRELKFLTKDKGQNVAGYVNKAKSYFYHRGKRLRSIEAFRSFGSLSPDAFFEWVDRVDKLDSSALEHILELVPNDIMSEMSKKFTLAIILENKARIKMLGEELARYKQQLKDKEDGEV